MTVKLFRSLATLLGFAMAISLGAALSAAQYGGGGRTSGAVPSEPNQNQDKNKEKGGSEKKEKVNKAEEAAYKAVLGAQGGDPAAQIQA